MMLKLQSGKTVSIVVFVALNTIKQDFSVVSDNDGDL